MRGRAARAAGAVRGCGSEPHRADSLCGCRISARVAAAGWDRAGVTAELKASIQWPVQSKGREEWSVQGNRFGGAVVIAAWLSGLVLAAGISASPLKEEFKDFDRLF